MTCALASHRSRQNFPAPDKMKRPPPATAVGDEFRSALGGGAGAYAGGQRSADCAVLNLTVMKTMSIAEIEIVNPNSSAVVPWRAPPGRVGVFGGCRRACAGGRVRRTQDVRSQSALTVKPMRSPGGRRISAASLSFSDSSVEPTHGLDSCSRARTRRQCPPATAFFLLLGLLVEHGQGHGNSSKTVGCHI